MPEPNYRQLENKSRKQHYVSVLVERLAGKDPGAIAKSLYMTEESVRRDLDYVRRNWSLIFSPDVGTPRPNGSEPVGFEDLRVEAECKECGARILAGEDRLVVAAVELACEINYSGGTCEARGSDFASVGETLDESTVGRISSFHYCEKCSMRIPEFHVSNPAFERGPAQTMRRRMDGIGGGEGETNRNTGTQQLDTSGQIGGDDKNKKLAAFLNSRNSSSMRPDMRIAAQMSVMEGLSQNEIAKRMGKDQSTISRMIAGAFRMAYAPHHN